MIRWPDDPTIRWPDPWLLTTSWRMHFSFVGPLHVDLRGLSTGAAQSLPLGSAKMLAQKENLPDVIGGVQHTAVRGLQHGMRLATDVHGAGDILRLQALYGVEDRFPAMLPAVHQLLAGVGGGENELPVAVAIGLFTVAGQEV